MTAQAASPHSEFRVALARGVAAAYAGDDNVAAVSIGGSTARGWADRHSDVELSVFYRRAPTRAERLAHIHAAGGAIHIFYSDAPSVADVARVAMQTNGRVGQLWPLEDGEFSEHYYVGGMNVGISGYEVATFEGYLRDVLEALDTDDRKHITIADVVNGRPVHGEAMLGEWKSRASDFPRALAEKLLRECVWPPEAWWSSEMLAERDARLMFADVVVQMERAIVRVLLALNRVYLAEPRFKWADRIVARLPIAPTDAARRLRDAFSLSPAQATIELQSLYEQTLDLVAQHFPDIDVELARGVARLRRPINELP